jgi:hypothetical protein
METKTLKIKRTLEKRVKKRECAKRKRYKVMNARTYNKNIDRRLGAPYATGNVKGRETERGPKDKEDRAAKQSKKKYTDFFDISRSPINSNSYLQ